jgi:ComF family protein
VCDEILSPEEIEKGIHPACENKLYPVIGAVCMHCGRPLGHEKSQKEETIPDYMQPESVYEYCKECRCKGYVHQNIRKSRSNIIQAKSLYRYKGEIKKTMYRFKYANKQEYARFFARQAVERYAAIFEKMNVIVPVPMYVPKQRQRGYNQAEIFAKEISRLTQIPVDLNCVQRVKDTTPQKELKDADRKNNIENAFQKSESIVQYEHILVVDDIYTTGYTAEAVAKELRKKGNCQIYLLSICIGGND